VTGATGHDEAREQTAGLLEAMAAVVDPRIWSAVPSATF